LNFKWKLSLHPHQSVCLPFFLVRRAFLPFHSSILVLCFSVYVCLFLSSPLFSLCHLSLYSLFVTLYLFSLLLVRHLDLFVSLSIFSLLSVVHLYLFLSSPFPTSICPLSVTHLPVFSLSLSLSLSLSFSLSLSLSSSLSILNCIFFLLLALISSSVCQSTHSYLSLPDYLSLRPDQDTFSRLSSILLSISLSFLHSLFSYFLFYISSRLPL
jgi:hypothetical protein